MHKINIKKKRKKKKTKKTKTNLNIYKSEGVTLYYLSPKNYEGEKRLSTEMMEKTKADGKDNISDGNLKDNDSSKREENKFIRTTLSASEG